MHKILFYILLNGCLLIINFSIAQEISFDLGEPIFVSVPDVEISPFFPDGHIAFIIDDEQYQMYWVGSNSSKTIGQDVSSMSSSMVVISEGESGSFDNGGAWLMSVFRQNQDTLIGFYHAEDHEFASDPSSDFIAWKSIALCKSYDNGSTWHKQGQIITSSTPKPDLPTWGGNGDHCVIWDTINSRWICFYQEHYLMMAVSYDQNANPGSWLKYYNGEYTEPGLDGENSPIPALINHPGGNPSVHYNTYLQFWVMLWHTWEGHSEYPKSIWLSTSTDLISWTNPMIVINSESNERYWYPTIIGNTDVEAEQTAILYYAHFPDINNWERSFVKRSITFNQSDELSINNNIIPNNYSISRIYPNPFNPITQITYGLPQNSNILISAYDLSGKHLNTIIEGYMTAGFHNISWNASYYPSGVYLIRMESGSFTQTQKVVLVK